MIIPKNTHKNNKTRNINVRFTEKEYDIVTDQANSCGKTVSVYVRDNLLNRRSPRGVMISVNHTLAEVQNIINEIRDNYDLTKAELAKLDELEEKLCRI